jgi:predicted DNA-binding transcriptional regulator AlpA
MDAGGKLPNAVRPSPGVKRWRRQEIQEWIDVGCPCRKDWEVMKKANR